MRAGGASVQTRLTRAGFASTEAFGARSLLRAGRASVQVDAGLLSLASPQALRTRAIGASPRLFAAPSLDGRLLSQTRLDGARASPVRGARALLASRVGRPDGAFARTVFLAAGASPRALRGAIAAPGRGPRVNTCFASMRLGAAAPARSCTNSASVKLRQRPSLMCPSSTFMIRTRVNLSTW